MHRPDSFPVLLFLLLVVPLRTFAASPIQERADRFLKLANAGYQALYRVNSEAQWLAVTDVTPEHDAAAEPTGKAYPAVKQNPGNITAARDVINHQEEVKQPTDPGLRKIRLH